MSSFTVNFGDLTKILDQIKIAERHAAGENLVDIIGQSAALLPMGLRTVDGSYNHLLPGQERVGAADELFPRLLQPRFLNDADGDTQSLGPGAPTITNTNYDPTIPGSHSVADADPRIISNLISDQTLNNPAALAAALTVAGVANVSAVSTQIYAAKAAIQPAITAAAAAQATETTYENALTSTSLAKTQVDLAKTGLASLNVSLGDGIVDPADQTTAADAVTAANAAVAAAQNAVNALASNPGVAAADLAAAQSFLATATTLASSVAAVAASVADNIITVPEFLALQAADAAAGSLAGTAATLVTNLTASEATATTASNAADTALATASTTFTGLLIDNGVEISPDGSILVENKSPDIGLSPSFNGWMTLFGQFFDHGLDLVTKGGNGTIYIPLQPDDPLYVPGGTSNFMVLTRATTFVDPVTGLKTETQNTTTPFIDQNQTYTSHPSHQVFLREYKMVDGQPVSTGNLLNGATGGVATWADVKAQASTMLGIELSDNDVHNVPLLRTDPYGKFIPGPNGFAQLITGLGTDGIPNTADDVVVEGNPAAPVNPTAVFAIRTDHAFLNDIAHNADPGTLFDTDGNPTTPGTSVVQADTDTDTGNAIATDFRGRKIAYDNELLDQHFITGDGRGNENIGLTAVHTIFHSEHNRVVQADKITILKSGDLAAINEWLVTDLAPGTVLPADDAGLTALSATLNWDGERLFQAGRFTTEMQYQHLVFEEFARKIQPNVDAFVFTNSADLDPGIVAEFAHTVYRFGHSMLTDTIDRLDNDLNVVGDADPNQAGDQQVGLIEAFLNPVAFNASGADAEAATGAIIRGMTRQAGNEIDEFVVEAVRNNLLGLPLDLPALNIARGRETGIPSLNEARAQFYELTGDAQLTPYTSWFDFAQNIKNPLSVVNFIAAYGTHSSIVDKVPNGTGGVREKTAAEKRAAALELVLGVDQNGDGLVAADALDFLQGKGAWTAANSGLNAVDFWIGGLAEEKMEFGGMLGSTFGFVFETQMENLQNGDRFYYLSRTQGMNLLNQLEPNTFTDIVMRNTDLGDKHATHLDAALFNTADLILELDPLVKQDNVDLGAADPTWVDPIQQRIDPKVVRILGTTDVDGDGEIDGNVLKFSGGEHVVLGGTEGNDTLIGDKGIDTLWGDGGDDRLNAGMESDQVFGGEGDDIIEDPFGDNFLRGNQGNDVISAGHGINLLFGDTGNDFLTNTTDTTEFFGGEGDDFILAGSAADALLGNEGDDWLEGGEGFDSLSGENSELFFNSPIVGHDVLNGQGNDTDYDGENGDDIMFQNAGIQRNNGMEGFDWAIHKGDNEAANTDLSLGINAPAVTPAFILRDRFDSIEGLSGWKHDDTLSGASKFIVAGGGFNSNLTQAGVDRIAGLADVIGAAGTLDPRLPNDANAVILDTANAFAGGEIILGGDGNDIIRGNLGNDIIDGDAWLNVRIAVHANKDGTGPVLFSVDSLAEIKARMISGEINPGQLKIVREILYDTTPTNNIDTAVFSDVQANYTIVQNADGSFTVTHNVPVGGGGGGRAIDDGTDTLRHIEVLKFADGIQIIDPTVTNAAVTGQLQIVDPTPPTLLAGETLTVALGTVADADGLPALRAFTFTWQVEQTPGAGDWIDLTDPVTGETIVGASFTPTDAFALDGLSLRVVGNFVDAHGVPEVVFSAPTNPVGVFVPGTAGGIVTISDTTPTEDQALTVTVADPQGVPPAIGFTWQRFDTATATWIDVGAGANFTPTDIAVNQPLRVIANYTDGAGNVESIVSAATANVININDPPVGGITIDDVTPTRNTVINATSNITDQDGMTTSVITFQWQSSTDGGTTWTDIAGANTAAFRPGVAQIGVTLRTIATYTDDHGTVETVTSGSTGIVGDIIRGTNAVDTLTGTAGSDTITGRRGNDIINALAGDDTISGDTGNDTINAGDGNDAINWLVGDGRDFIDGGAGTDTVTITGDATAETYRIYSRAAAIAAGITGLNAATEIVITRNGTNNASIVAELDNVEEIRITGQGGGDTFIPIGNFSPTSLATSTIHLDGSAGNDTVNITGLTSGHRVVFTSGGGSDTFVGPQRPQDVIDVGTGPAPATNADGTTTVHGDSGTVTISSSSSQGDEGETESENENENETEDGDHASNGSGSGQGGTGTGTGTTPQPALNAIHNGTSGDDTYVGGLGDDVLTGADGDDTLFGLEGDDSLAGGAGADHLIGGSGGDLLIGNGGADTILAGSGNDTVLAGAGDDTIFGDAGDDLIFGNEGRDVIDAGAGNDTIHALAGDGDDVVNGGLGDDTIDFQAITSSIVIDLGSNGTGSATSTGSGHDTLNSIENAKGGSGNDTFIASNAVNVFDGGAGNDTFIFRTAEAANGDRIEGFQPGDTIDLQPLYASLQLGSGDNFDLVTSSVFTAAGQLRLRVDGNDTVIEGNTDNSADVDFAIKIVGRTNLTAQDFA